MIIMATRNKNISSAAFASKIKSQDIGSAYVFVGEDSFAMDNMLSIVRKEFVPPESEEFNLELLHADSDSVTAAEIINAAETVPFLGGMRVIWVKYVHELPASELDILGVYLEKITKSPQEDLLLVLLFSELDKRTKFAKLVSKLNLTVEFTLGEIKSINDYIFSKYNKQISRTGETFLEKLTGGNSLSLRNEIEKVCMYVGDREKITEEDVINICSDTAKRNEWALSDLILQGNLSGLLKLLEDIRREGIDDMYQYTIIAMAISKLPTAQAALRDGTFFRRKWEFFRGQNLKPVENHLRALSEKQLALLLSRLMYMEIGFKGANLPKTLLNDFACLAATITKK